MNEVRMEAIIALPRAQVWRKMRDLRTPRFYVTGVKSIEFNPGPREGVGASRHIVMTRGAPVDETVIAWEEGVAITFKVHRGDRPAAPFKSATIRYALEDAPGNQTRFINIFSYEMAGGIFGRLLEVCLVRPGMRKRNATLGPMLKEHYETGRVVNPTLVSPNN